MKNLAQWAGVLWVALAIASRPARGQPAAGPGPGASNAAVRNPEVSAAGDGDGSSISAQTAAGAAFRRGVDLREKGDLEASLAAFEQAYELLPAYEVLYFIGAVNVELRRWAPARRAFEAYLQFGSDKLAPAHVAHVRSHLAELEKVTATLTLTLNVADAVVKIDGDELEPKTFSDLILDPGKHVVRVTKSGFVPLEQIVSAEDGQHLHLVLPLTRSEPVNGALDAHPRTFSGHATEIEGDTSNWLLWTTTGVLAAGWMTTAALAVKARHDRDVIERAGTSDDRIDDARRLHISLAVASDVLLAATLASAGVSAYLTWWSEDGRSGTGTTTRQSHRAVDGLTFNVMGRF